ncbi:FadR/GntR family transcriptional regulator [Nocardia sp. NPDC058518]|uniref:FadR/GntR family transcriptional regulator n=1 Tax=Nocardia sp. NPDC058518 TaxID=3346534 RepID=UPI003648A542
MTTSRPVPAKSSFLLAEQILQDIVDDNLEPGDALLPEKAMVEKYEVGRGTVREALRLLEYQGAIQIKQGLNGGPYVQLPNSVHFASTIGFRMQLQRTPFRTIVEVRTAMEPMICRLAAERISDTAIDELQRTIDEMKVMVDSHEDSRRFNDLNTRFHNVVGWASANPLFQLLADSLLDIMDGAVVGLRYSEESRAGVIAAHEAIAAALRERDPDQAAAAMTVHLEQWEKYANKMYPQVLEETVPWSWAGATHRGGSPRRPA